MLLAEPIALSTLIATAAAVGVGHTLAGPDHYLPLVAVARSSGFGARRALLFTAFAGLLHCAASALIVAAALALATPAAELVGLQDLRGNVAGWAMLGGGLLLALAAWRRARTLPAARPVLLALFALGPCEWLLPNALAANVHGLGGVAAVTAVFTLATVLTMLGCVAVGLRLLPQWRRDGVFARVLPGLTTAACGALVIAGL